MHLSTVLEVVSPFEQEKYCTFPLAGVQHFFAEDVRTLLPGMGLDVQTKINSITLPSDKARKPLYANWLAEGDAKYLAR